MAKQTIYILHKQGSPSHYIALETLLKQHQITVKYREFSIFTKLYKSLLGLNSKLFFKQFKNILFILYLLLSRDKKVVLGIAPFDRKIVKVLRYLENHRIFYHTSWTVWDQSFYPNTKQVTANVLETWRFFLEEKAEHIFTVSQTSKNQLLENYHIQEERISVVKHALSHKFSRPIEIKKNRNSFIYYGRLLPEKGIAELLDYFTKTEKATLTIIGKGRESQEVKLHANRHQNIHYQEFIDNQEALKYEIASHQFLILNSKKTKKWEELFGLVIIEAMSQGVIPIATAHSGPKEIIHSDFGFLYEENHLKEILDKVLENSHDFEKMSQIAIENAKFYRAELIKERWEAILE